MHVIESQTVCVWKGNAKMNSGYCINWKFEMFFVAVGFFVQFCAILIVLAQKFCSQVYIAKVLASFLHWSYVQYEVGMTINEPSYRKKKKTWKINVYGRIMNIWHKNESNGMRLNMYRKLQHQTKCSGKNERKKRRRATREEICMIKALKTKAQNTKNI